jgi:hypothetical protein
MRVIAALLAIRRESARGNDADGGATAWSGCSDPAPGASSTDRSVRRTIRARRSVDGGSSGRWVDERAGARDADPVIASRVAAP